MTVFGPLVSGAWLREHLGEPGLRVIDLRFYLDGRPGRAAHETAHIPGAVFVDLADVTAPTGPGRHPLPSRERFQAALRGAGVNRGDRVVAYDDLGGFSAARLWFLLRYFGHEDAAILDGGLGAWPGRTESGAVSSAVGDFTAGEPHREWVVDRAGVVNRGDATVVLDARAGERFRGEVEPLDPRPGHIPGARNAVWKDNLNADLTFKSAAELRLHYRGLGVEGDTDVIASCGSGVSACVDLVGLELAGINGVRLYEGSFSEWSATPDVEVATGPA